MDIYIYIYSHAPLVSRARTRLFMLFVTLFITLLSLLLSLHLSQAISSTPISTRPLSQLSKPFLRPPFPPLHRIDDPYRTLGPPYQNQRPLSQILHPFSQPWSSETFISKVLASRLGSNFEPLKHQKT